MRLLVTRPQPQADTWVTHLLGAGVDACALARHGPHRARWKRAVIGFGASAVTHPVVWFVFPRLARRWGQGYALMVVEAETFAVVVEAAHQCMTTRGIQSTTVWTVVMPWSEMSAKRTSS